MTLLSPAIPDHASAIQGLNPGQQDAADAVFRFLLSPDKEFSISGAAGTGKTFLMHHIISSVLADYVGASKLLGETPRPWQLALTATTNKAAEVLAGTTGWPTQTIHSFLSLRVRDNYDTGVSEVLPTQGWAVLSNKLIFIDEASMIDTTLYGYIQKSTDDTCKIIYLGDHCQMAPVNERISKVYENPKHFAVLTQPMRNAGQPALVALCQQLRETVETGIFRPIREVPGVIDYLDDQAAQAFIDQTFATETRDTRILCYTNARVQEFNGYVRGLRGYPDRLIPGERVINNSVVEVTKQLNLRVEEELDVRMVLAGSRIINGGKPTEIEVYKAILRRPGTSLDINVEIPVDHDVFKAILKDLARRKDWASYYALKNHHPDLRPHDAGTVYKAQGSTYETVFLDLTNLGRCQDPEQLARMLYVGGSRARSRVVLNGALPLHLFS